MCVCVCVCLSIRLRSSCALTPLPAPLNVTAHTHTRAHTHTHTHCHPQAASFDACDTSVATEISGVGPASVTLELEGGVTYWLACTVGTHCEAGMKVRVCLREVCVCVCVCVCV